MIFYEFTTPPIQSPMEVLKPDVQYDTAMKTAVELINLQKRLGLKLTIHDKNLNNISGKFESMADLLRNPEFISRLNQELHISNDDATSWFKLKLRNGKLVSITFLLLHQLYLAKKTKAERKFIKEEKRSNAVAFQVFLTQRNFLYAEYLMARFSWGSNIIIEN